MKLCASLHGNNNEFQRLNITVIIDFQLKANSKFEGSVASCYGVTKNPNENDFLLVFHYAEKGDLHNNLSKNFKGITWQHKIDSLESISFG